MSRQKNLVCLLLLVGVAWAGDGKDKSAALKPSAKGQQIDLVATPEAKPRVEYTRVPLGFEPNKGQADAEARFVANSHGYSVRLDATGARFQFHGKDSAASDTVRMDLENANRQAALTGESPLPGKADYFPTGDPKSWITNVPTYSRVHYSSVYPGVDVSFYGTANRLEYDFLIQAGFDPSQVQMKISGAQYPTISSAGDLVLPRGKGGLHFLKPVAYQLAANGKTRESVNADYRLAKNASGEPVVTFALGKYDHARQLIIDPVVDALSYSQYINEYYVGAVTVDSSGNSYVTGQAYPTNFAFYVNKFGPTGTQLYAASFGTGNNGFPYAIAVDSSGQAYVTGQIDNGSTVPATANAYQGTPGTGNQVFLAVLSASGATLPYCTYLSGADSGETNAIGLALDSSANIYIGGHTYSVSFPTTAGAYQGSSNPSNQGIGFVAKFNATKSGAASLIYSTLIGSTTSSFTQVNRVAVDYAGNAYLAVQDTGNSYPVTAGAVNYTGLQAANGGAYVTKLNPTGTALVYSAYLGYGGASGIAVDAATSGNPSAYVSGWVSEADFPTTAGAYQTNYASGFAVKLSGDGTSEIYSTFLSGPSGYTGAAVDPYPTLAIPVGCASSCNAYITGRTNSSDFPAVNPIQAAPAQSPYSAFIVELNSTGTSALFSSYLSGYLTEVYRTQDSQSFGITPAIAVDGSGNIYVAGNTTGSSTGSDFPITIPTPAGSNEGFLAKINASATAGFTLTLPTSIAFGGQEVGITSPISTIRLSNYSGAAVTGLSIVPSPSSVFAETDNCAGTIAAGSYCSLNVTFTPNAPSARTGALTITSSASNSPITVALSGSGGDGEYTSTSVSSLTFGSQAIGTTSSAQTFTITNKGDETSATNIYTDAAQFVPVNNCPPQLAPGASCTVSVTFAPTEPGLYLQTLTIVNSASGPNFTVALSGTGVVAGATTTLTPSTASLQFGNEVTNTTSGTETFYLTNTGTEPVAIYSAVASGNFSVSYFGCTLPGTITPQQACQVNVTFSPVTAGTLTGAVTFTDSASGSPQTVSLSGIGVASTETVEFNPSTSVSFPDTPQGTSSGNQTIYLQNTGSAPITVDRTTVSSGFTMTYSSCEGIVVNGFVPDGLGNANVCQVNVEFTPSATASGSQNGTLTFIDNAPGSPHVVNLVGNAITATGTLGVAPSVITFGPQPQGVTTGVQYLYVQNPGNTPVTVTAVTFSGTNGTDYTTTGSNCGTPPFVITPQQFGCYFPVQFTPGGTGTRTATFTVSSSAGNATGSITGTGLAATQALTLIPTSLNLGSVVKGQSGNYEGLYLYNTGTETVSFTTNPTITGTNAADFTLNGGCANNGNTLAPAATCGLSVIFSPSIVGTESATLTFTDSAGTQTFALSGTGVATTPTYTVAYHAISFPAQLENTTSPNNYSTTFYNNSSTSVTFGNVALTGSFIIPHGYDTCSGQTIGAGNNCYVFVQFAPTTAGYLTGTLTFDNSGGTPLAGAPVLPLDGYGVVPTYSAFVNPTTNRFVEFQVIGTQSGADPTYLYNTGNTAFTVGNITGTNLGVAPSAEFSIAGADGGYDGCSNQTLTAGSYCQVNITFTPSAAGTRTGTIGFPVTYANSTTATITGNITGTGTAEKNSAVLTPPNGAYIDQVVGVTTVYNVTTYLNNSGNQPFTVGILTNSNSTEFSTASSVGGYDSCSGSVVQPGQSCQINVRFTPSATGSRTGTITFPVTFADHTTTSLNYVLTGKGVASAKTVVITPSSFQFGTEVQSATTGAQTLGVVNTGNLPVTIGTDTISTNSAEFAISYDSCNGVTLNPNGACNINVTFTPSSSATGSQTGVLKIADNATGGPHTVALSGIAITAAQQILVAPGTLAFGNQPAGSNSSAQVFYVTNQGDTTLTNNGITLGGTNAADFSIVYNQCGGAFTPHANCYVTVQFNPPANATGALTATITETDSGTPGTHTVTLTGTAVTPGPAATVNPSALTFTKQNVGSTSATQAFSVTNTGSATLNISTVVSTNTTEFPIYSDGCSGTALAPNTHCVVSVQFSPTLGGTRTGSIKVTDTATGSPQTVALTGTGYGIPATTYTPSSLTFGNTNINASSATQSITLNNPGTDTLAISGVAITGGNASEFTQTNTCAATLAPAASCVITVTFKPTASGSQSAYVTVTDNANNIAGSTQSTALTGTGVAVPTAAAAPTTLTFASTNIGVTSAAQTSTITNSGTGPLTIASIAIGGTNAGDYAETNTCGSTLVAGSNCSISVTFKPTASGTRTATVTVTDNANGTAGSTQTVSLTGTGAGLSAAAVSPTSLTFTDQSVGTSSAAQTVTLSNSGTGPLTIASIVLSGTNSADYSTTNTCAGSVAAAGTCSISVTFKPTGIGSRVATLTVTDNANNTTGSTQTVSISGTGVGIPAATPSPTSLSFSSNVGTTTAAQSVTLTNGGTGVLTISSIAISGTNAGDFATTNTCSGSVAIGGNCSISVTFDPTAAGSRSATLTINDNANNTASSQTVSLSGTATGVSSATVSPTTEAFGNQNVGSTSTSKTITLSNSGSSALTIASIALSGTNSTDFATTNNCAGSVAAASSCSIAITFSPSAVGSRVATLTVTDNANNTSGSTQTVSLTGTGVGVAAAAASPTTLVFSNQNVGTTSAASSTTLTNSGTAALTIASIAISGTNASDYATTNNCSGSVAAGASCAISVTFKPGAAGTRTGTLTITDNAGNTTGSTQTVALTGTGIGVPTAGVTPASLTFASTATGSTSAAQTVTVSNSGTGPLSISQIVIGGANPSDFAETTNCGSSLAVSATCTISVTFTPAVAGSLTANLHVIDNSGNGSATQSVTLTGTGATTSNVPSVVSVSPSSGTGSTQIFTAVYSDPSGASSLTSVRFLMNTAVSGANACYVVYTPSTNALILENNAGNAASAAVTPGSTSSVSNSQCVLSGVGSSATISGNTLTLKLALGFTTTFTAAENVYLFAASSSGTAGFTQESTWTPGTSTAPAAVSVTPSSGTGATQAFTALYADPKGVADFATIRFLMNTSVSAANGCYVLYTPSSNLLSLENAAGNGTAGTVTPGQSGTATNGLCTLSGPGSSVSSGGDYTSLTLALSFGSGFTAAQNVYLLDGGNGGSSGFVQEGTWTP